MKLVNTPGGEVKTVVGHMCQYGMESRDADGMMKPVLKPTRWMSTAGEVLGAWDVLPELCVVLH